MYEGPSFYRKMYFMTFETVLFPVLLVLTIDKKKYIDNEFQCLKYQQSCKLHSPTATITTFCSSTFGTLFKRPIYQCCSATSLRCKAAQ